MKQAFSRLRPLAIFCIIFQSLLQSQDLKIYQAEPAREILITTGGIVTWLGARLLLEEADKATQIDISSLNPLGLWAIDRGAVDNNSASAKSVSDFLLYGSIAIPLVSYLNQSIEDQGWAMGVMFLETAIITDVFNTSIKALSKRYRPYAYNPELSIDEKISNDTRLSFLSGHTSISAAMSFMTARVMTSLHPDSPWNKFIWSAAVAIPAVTGYMRVRAGRHFPTDVMAGYVLGTGIGLLIPEIHKNKKIKLQMEGNGLGIALRLN